MGDVSISTTGGDWVGAADVATILADPFRQFRAAAFSVVDVCAHFDSVVCSLRVTTGVEVMKACISVCDGWLQRIV